VYAYLKHFALNDQEDNRQSMLCTWSTEQAIREIYLKPFEIAVKEGKARAIMSAYNYVGIEWAGGCDELLNKVLRDEWGFQGFVLTDYFNGRIGYLNADRAIRNGNDAMLINYQTPHNDIEDRSATSVKAMRQASKNIMYTVVNSRVYRDAADQLRMPSWQVAAIIINIILLILLAVVEFLMIRNFHKKTHGIQMLPGKKDNP
jgi:beta-glucosidase